MNVYHRLFLVILVGISGCRAATPQSPLKGINHHSSMDASSLQTCKTSIPSLKQPVATLAPPSLEEALQAVKKNLPRYGRIEFQTTLLVQGKEVPILITSAPIEKYAQSAEEKGVNRAIEETEEEENVEDIDVKDTSEEGEELDKIIEKYEDIPEEEEWSYHFRNFTVDMYIFLTSTPQKFSNPFYRQMGDEKVFDCYEIKGFPLSPVQVEGPIVMTQTCELYPTVEYAYMIVDPAIPEKPVGGVAIDYFSEYFAPYVYSEVLVFDPTDNPSMSSPSPELRGDGKTIVEGFERRRWGGQGYREREYTLEWLNHQLVRKDGEWEDEYEVMIDEEQ